MSFEDILKIVGALVATATSVYTLWQLANNDKQGKWGRLREEYKFAKEFLVELRKEPEMSDFQRAKGYRALAGFQAIGVKDGDYLMSLEEPAKAMDRYVMGFDYVEYDPLRESEQIQFLKKYQPAFARRWRKFAYGVVYVFCVFFAVAPLCLAGFFTRQPGALAIAVITCLVVFAPGAWMTLQTLIKIIAAEKLVQHQIPAKAKSASSLSADEKASLV